MTDYVISEEQLNRCKMGWCIKPEDKQKILSRPLSEELKKERERVLNEFSNLAHQGFADRERRWLLDKVQMLRGEP